MSRISPSVELEQRILYSEANFTSVIYFKSTDLVIIGSFDSDVVSLTRRQDDYVVNNDDFYNEDEDGKYFRIDTTSIYNDDYGRSLFGSKMSKDYDYTRVEKVHELENIFMCSGYIGGCSKIIKLECSRPYYSSIKRFENYSKHLKLSDDSILCVLKNPSYTNKLIQFHVLSISQDFKVINEFHVPFNLSRHFNMVASKKSSSFFITVVDIDESNKTYKNHRILQINNGTGLAENVFSNYKIDPHSIYKNISVTELCNYIDSKNDEILVLGIKQICNDYLYFFNTSSKDDEKMIFKTKLDFKVNCMYVLPGRSNNIKNSRYLAIADQKGCLYLMDLSEVEEQKIVCHSILDNRDFQLTPYQRQHLASHNNNTRINGICLRKWKKCPHRDEWTAKVVAVSSHGDISFVEISSLKNPSFTWKTDEMDRKERIEFLLHHYESGREESVDFFLKPRNLRIVCFKTLLL